MHSAVIWSNPLTSQLIRYFQGLFRIERLGAGVQRLGRKVYIQKTAPNAIARFKNPNREASSCELSSCNEAGEPRSHNHNVNTVVTIFSHRAFVEEKANCKWRRAASMGRDLLLLHRQGSKRCCQQRVEELQREFTSVLLLLYHFSLKINSSRGEAKKTDCTSVTICGFLHLSSYFSKLF
jgi:hypothetical protein